MSYKLDKWNDNYCDADIANAKPVQVLNENLHLLPTEGDALDLACGRAGNAITLASNGGDAINISPVVLIKAC